MKRGGLVSKAFLRNAAIVLVIAVVAYVVMYGVKEGFQADNTVTKMVTYSTPADPGTVILDKKEFKSGVLKNIRFFVWGPATADGGAGWKERTTELQRAWGLNTLLKTEFVNMDGSFTNILPPHMQAGQMGAFLVGSKPLDNTRAAKAIKKETMDKAASIKISNLNNLNWGASPKTKIDNGGNLKIVYEFA